MEAVLRMPQTKVKKHNRTKGSSTKTGRIQLNAEALLENALIATKSGALQMKYPCTADDALYCALGSIVDMAAFFCEDRDSILGHIKLLVDCSGGRASLSLTRTGAPEIVRHMGWDGSKEIHSCVVSVNVFSLTQTEVPVDYLIDRFIA